MADEAGQLRTLTERVGRLEQEVADLRKLLQGFLDEDWTGLEPKLITMRRAYSLIALDGHRTFLQGCFFAASHSPDVNRQAMRECLAWSNKVYGTYQERIKQSDNPDHLPGDYCRDCQSYFSSHGGFQVWDFHDEPAKS